MGKWLEFGKLLRQLRKEHKWIQTDLSKKLEGQGYKQYSKGAISKWENGRSRPPEDIVEILEDIFYSTVKGTLLLAAGYTREESIIEKPTNWIEKHYVRTGEYPALPEPLNNIVENYTLGEPVHKKMKVIPSGPAYTSIKQIPGLLQKWREFLEWLDIDPDEYDYKSLMIAPPSGIPPEYIIHY